MPNKKKAITRTAHKVMINMPMAQTLLSDVEMEILNGIIKKLENIEYFLEQKRG